MINAEKETIEKTRKRIAEVNDCVISPHTLSRLQTVGKRQKTSTSVQLFNKLQREAKDNVNALAKRGKHGDNMTKQHMKAVTPKPAKKTRRR